MNFQKRLNIYNQTNLYLVFPFIPDDGTKLHFYISVLCESESVIIYMNSLSEKAYRVNNNVCAYRVN